MHMDAYTTLKDPCASYSYKGLQLDFMSVLRLYLEMNMLDMVTTLFLNSSVDFQTK